MSNPTPEQAAALAEIKVMQAEHAKKALLARDVSQLSAVERQAAWRDQFAVSPELQAEFRDPNIYVAYKKAQFAGVTK